MNYFDKVHKAYPEIHNENAVIENKYFSSCGHMNDVGARIFTAIIIHDFFKTKNENSLPTPEYPHPLTGNSGGIGTSIKNLAVGLVAAGCEVRIYFSLWARSRCCFKDENVVIQRIKNVKIKGLSWFYSKKTRTNYQSIA
jgi:hypothetical protein